MGKKDLSSIQLKEENCLPEKATIKTRKSEKERESETLSIKITPSEMAFLQRKKKQEAGELAPMGAFIKEFLRNETNLLNE